MLLNKEKMKRSLVAVLAAAMIVCVIPSVAFAATDTVTSGSTSSETAVSGVHAYKYNMSVKLNTKKDSMNEMVTVYVRNDIGKTLKSIEIRNMAHAIIKLDSKGNSYSGANKKKSSRILSAVNVKTGKRIPLKYKKEKTVVRGDLTKTPLNPGQTIAIKLKCKVDIPCSDDRFGYHKDKYGKMYELSFCFPYVSMYENGKWHESPYFNDGENRYRSVANYNVRFKAPKSYTVAVTGTESKKGGTTTIKAENVRDFAIVACNYMKKQTKTVNGIKVNNYYLKINRNNTYKNLAMGSTVDSIKLFTDKFGAYPYSELDVVQGRMGTSNGMEYPGIVMIAADEYSKGFNPKLAIR